MGGAPGRAGTFSDRRPVLYTGIMRAHLLLLIAVALPACTGDAKDLVSNPDDSAGETGRETAETDESGETATTPVAPGAEFDRFCGDLDWDAALEEAEVSDPGGRYAGYLPDHTSWRSGTVEMMKLIPPHPFHVTKIRMEFADGVGTARVRLMTTFGRSYPSGWPDLDEDGTTLLGPYDVEIDTTGGRQEVEIDVSAEGLFLEPTQHYALLNEYPDRGAPTTSVVPVPSGEGSRALIILPNEDTPYGLGSYNFNMSLEGQYFCQWSDEDRWFEEQASPAFGADVSAYMLTADINGDGHTDVMTYGDGPLAYLGDGAGGFTRLDDPWPEAADSSMLIFGDVDNDGDQDAFAATYIGADNDGDGVTRAEGDCNDADATVYPGAPEVTDAQDNDCDQIADDGADTGDADADGFSVAAGDCDDNRDDVFPGGAELKDSRDNDCDGVEDEDFFSKMLLNDGSANFTAVPVAGLEVSEPTTAGGFGDANEDGYLDLYFGNWLEHYPDDPAVQDRYYEGNGDGTFTDALAAAGLELPTPYSVYGVQWNDWNDDGHPDIFVGNYHLYDNQLWKNLGDGTFEDVALEVGVAHDDEESPYEGYPGGHTYGSDFADVDNDGDMDMYMANLAHPRTQPWGDPSMFLISSGGPDYTMDNLREEYGFVYDEGDVNVMFADFDNDMDQDVAIASLYTQHYARVYRNEGGVAFTDVTYEFGLNVEEAISVVWVDVDEDGDEDLLVGDRFGDVYTHLLINRVGQDRSWTDLVLEGTTTNRDAVGARVWLEAGGVTQIRDVTGGDGNWNTQRPKVMHFGLGDNTAVDAVTVRWVGGATETFTGVGVGGRFRLVEGAGVATE